jgi:hypothetical protein
MKDENTTIKSRIKGGLIGSALGDPHINRSLSYGIKYANAKFLHITKSKNFFGSIAYLHMQQHMMNKKNYLKFSAKNGWLEATNNSAKIYKDGLEDFLLKQDWESIQRWI